MSKPSCATLEGRPVRLNDIEAWWVINGEWKPLHLAEAAFNAALLRKEEFERCFPNLPPLPGTAFRTNDVIVDPTFQVDMRASGDELYRHARSLRLGDPKIPLLVRRAKVLYTEARSRLSPEWNAVLSALPRDDDE